MFEYLNDHPRVLVTGPQRTGTTICARMIAADCGHEAVLEEEFSWKDVSTLKGILALSERRGYRYVVQCPGLFHKVKDLALEHGCAVVMMVRPLQEIVESRERMYGKRKGYKYSPVTQNNQELKKLGIKDKTVDSAEAKYDLWRTIKQEIPHAYEVEYARLVDHPLWVTPEERRKHGKAWHNRRTE